MPVCDACAGRWVREQLREGGSDEVGEFAEGAVVPCVDMELASRE